MYLLIYFTDYHYKTDLKLGKAKILSIFLGHFFDRLQMDPTKTLKALQEIFYGPT